MLIKGKKTGLAILAIILSLVIFVTIFVYYTTRQKTFVFFPNDARVVVSKIDQYIKSAPNMGVWKNDWLAVAKGLNGKIRLTGNGFFIEDSNWFFFKNGDMLIGVCDSGKVIVIAKLYKDNDWIIKDYYLAYRKPPNT